MYKFLLLLFLFVSPVLHAQKYTIHELLLDEDVANLQSKGRDTTTVFSNTYFGDVYSLLNRKSVRAVSNKGDFETKKALFRYTVFVLEDYGNKVRDKMLDEIYFQISDSLTDRSSCRYFIYKVGKEYLLYYANVSDVEGDFFLYCYRGKVYKFIFEKCSKDAPYNNMNILFKVKERYVDFDDSTERFDMKVFDLIPEYQPTKYYK